MSIWKKVVTAIRGGASEAGEAIVDANAIRILEQEQRDAEAAVLKARNGLVEIKAKHKLSLQRLAAYDNDITNWEGKAIAALGKGEESLASECANQIAQIEGQREQERLLNEQFGKQVDALHAQVSRADAQIKGLKQQVEMAKARETVQQARVATAAATGGASGKLETAVDSLARIKQRQDERDAKLEAAEELAAAANGGDLDKRLREAGIGASSPGGADVLARLKARQNTPQ
ncbi:PspA/IM30 family protein [Pseudomonas typographi]|uniref:PspA/IM30 family protein n=1 Tax=Pseudomonas typographi TaxID=2715964 RepID=A0ABR7Z1E7_9PSED|nr:PspA/IM30 family protein [Pseudomonas typographi]MBD1554618.1 PspA/IM30 family protein [Pseudomonas typographi]MBD1589735.1 PspA/IM30 family protein [Pseudomonas typographi]MBD1599212.1 PspA/IM30 family protein [Pseudomonas typographi]